MKTNMKYMLQRVISIISIIVVALLDFVPIGMSAVSYAIDVSETNNSNVSFYAYFQDENGKEINNIDSNINNKKIKLYVDIQVKNEGYFNGKIKLENSSFKFNKNYTNEYVKEIEENTIILNQINAGSNAKVEVGIEYINSDKIMLNSLNMENTIKLIGVYKNSKKEIDIEGSSIIKINWKSDDELKANLSIKLLTNKIYKVNEKNSRIVQFLVNSNLNGNVYPIKSTQIKIDVPSGANEVKAISRFTEATNSNLSFNENNYTYNKEIKTLYLSLENKDENGYIEWNKGKYDSFIITYIYPEDIDIENEKINVENVINTYDDKEAKGICSIENLKEKDGIIEENIELNENELYKGKLYTGNERIYNTTTNLCVNYVGIDNQISFEEKESHFISDSKEITADIRYVSTKINKSDFQNMFGTNGTLKILGENGEIISTIDNTTQADKNGYINIKYASIVKSIKVETSEPIKEGILKIYHSKAVRNDRYSKEDIQKLTGIKNEIIGKETETKIIGLKEVESKANIKINKETLSSIEENKGIEIVATLETNDESKELYKDPVVDIKFPKEFEYVNITSAKALYRNGLKVKSCKKLRNNDGNIIMHIEFEGEQKNYSSEILNGLEIHIYANIIISKLTPSKSVKLEMQCINKNLKQQVNRFDTNIDLISKDGMMLYNELKNYNNSDEIMTSINGEEKVAVLDMNTGNATSNVTTAIINNYNKKIEGKVVLTGNIPSKDKSDTFNSTIKNLKVDNSDAEVYYSKDVKASSTGDEWTKDNKDAKAYKVVLDGIDSGEIVKITYDLSIPKNLSYNNKGTINTEIGYNYDNKKLKESTYVVLRTEEAVVENEQATKKYNISGIEVEISEIVGNKQIDENDSIYNGEIIKYIVNLKNSTGKDLKNIKVNIEQINGLLFSLVKKKVYNPSIYTNETATGYEDYWQVTDTNVKKFENLNISNGEELKLEYQIVSDNSKGQNTYSSISIETEDNSLNGDIKTNEHKIQDAEIKLLFTPAVSEQCNWLSETIQQSNLKVINTTSNELDNVEVQFILSKELEIEEKDITCSDNIQIENKNKTKNSLGQTIITVTIKKLAINQEGYIYINSYISDINKKKYEVDMYATAMINGKTYYSNKIIREITRSRKNINVSQIAKINGKEIDKNTKANNGDIVQLNITVENQESEDVKLNISDNIQLGLEVNGIELINNDNSKTNLLTENYKNNYFSYDVSIKSGEKINIVITAKVNTSILDIGTKKISNKIKATEGGVLYSQDIEFDVNVFKPDDGNLNIEVIQTSNPKNKSIIKDGQNVEFSIILKNTCDHDRTVNVQDFLNKSMKNVKVYISGEDKTLQYVKGNLLEINNYSIKANTEVNIKITSKIDLTNYEGDFISNSVLIKSKYPDYASNEIILYTSKEAYDNARGNNSDKYSITGMAWIDSNADGKRDTNEEKIKDLEVIAININNKNVIESKVSTGEDGTYKLTLPQGNYIVAFSYNNDDYYVTTYHADNISDVINSDAISKKIKLENETKTYGVTDEIKLTANKKNIDIGLVARSKFDFKLDKYITKIVVTNSKESKTYNLDKSTLGKVEISAKYLKSSTVLVEYELKVTNVGDIKGNIKNIVDYLPSDFTFNSSLNSDWYLSGNKLYNESLSNKKLDKGESTEVKLILTKKMTESNIGLVNNTALINYTKDVEDVNTDNNKGSADLIVSIRTGSVMKVTLLILSLIVCVSIASYCLVIKKDKKIF